MYNAMLLFSTRDCQLFKLMRSSSPCLHHLLPPVRSVSYSPRQRGHPYELLEHKYQKLSVASLCDQFLITYRPNLSVVWCLLLAKFLSLIWWLSCALLIVWVWCKRLCLSGTIIKNLLYLLTYFSNRSQKSLHDILHCLFRIFKSACY